MGAVLRFLPLKESLVDEAIASSVPKKVLDVNRKAFLAGKAQKI
jgi:Pyruvate/2-oxoacid:ferredoxin oxidoreductase gamma subunit